MGLADKGRQGQNLNVRPTVVVFRRWYRKQDGTGIIALFPETDAGNGMCQSFEHVGQHGAAHYDSVIARTKTLRPEDWEARTALRRELESPRYGYRLTERKRRNGRQAGSSRTT